MDAWLTNPDTDSAIVPASALTGLEEAVRADLAEGTLGRRYLLENRDRLENCYYNDLYLEFRPAGRTGGEEEDGYTVCITLQSGARHTLAVLQACGLDARWSPRPRFRRRTPSTPNPQRGAAETGRGGFGKTPNRPVLFF